MPRYKETPMMGVHGGNRITTKLTRHSVAETAYDRVVNALKERGFKTRPIRNGVMAQCPAHEDNDPSLTVTDGADKVLVHCHAGCHTEHVLAALDLHYRDLWDNPGGTSYHYDDGRIVHRSTDKRFRQSGNTQNTPTLYRLGEVKQAVSNGQTIYLVEGEKDANNLTKLMGVVATTAPMGASNISKCDLTPLYGSKVIAVVDKDTQGQQWANQVHTTLQGHVQSLEFKQAKTGKDSSDHLAAGLTLEDLENYPHPLETLDSETDTPGEDTNIGDTWTPLPLNDVLQGLLDGTYTRPTPALAPRNDGQHLFYTGRVNGIAGDSNAGKTWTALYATKTEITAGNTVIYIDLEDDPAGILTRLLDLGVTPEDIQQRFIYIRPDEPYGITAQTLVHATVKQHAPTLVVIDSTGEAMALDGAKPNEDDDTARWFRTFPTAIARLGPGVLVLDHMPKSNDRGLFAIGSQRKRAAITGALYIQEIVKPFSRHQPGVAKLVCAKDRPGNYHHGQRVADMHVNPTGGGLHLELRQPADEDTTAGVFRPTTLMERVSTVLQAAGEPLNTRRLLEQVKGKQKHVLAAIEILVNEGHIHIVEGPRNAKLHTLVKPYTQAGDPHSDLFVTPLPSGGVECFPSLEGGGGNTHSTGMGNSGDTVGTQSGYPLDINETEKETQGTQLTETVGSVSRVWPTDLATCKQCKTPLDPVVADYGYHPGCEPQGG